MHGKTIRTYPLALLLVIVVARGLAFGGDLQPAEARRRAAQSVARLGIQTQFPEVEVNREKDSYAPNSGGNTSAPVSDAAATSMLWIAVAVFGAILLLTLLENMPRRRNAGSGKRRATPDESAALAGRMNAHRNESDALAAKGDYAGAMHILLLESVEAMRRRLGMPIAHSLTSREILARGGLEPDAGHCFDDIVRRVEISWFGDHLPGPDEYARCRESYTELAALIGRGRQP